MLGFSTIMVIGWPDWLNLAGSYSALFGLGSVAIIIGVVAFAVYPVVRCDLQSESDHRKLEPATSALTKDKSSLLQTSSPVPDVMTSNEHHIAPAAAPAPLPVKDGVAPFDYQQIVEHIEQIVFKIDPNGDIGFLSASWEHLLDYTVADSIHQPFDAFIHPEDRPLVDAQISGLLRGKRDNCQFETRMIARNGTSHWLELRAKAVNEEERSVIGTLTDIDRQKQVEANLRAVRRSLSTLLNSIPGMVYRCKSNRNWSFEFASDGCLEVTGYEPYQLVNDPNFYFQQIMFPDDRDDAWNHAHQQVMLQRNFQLVYRIINRSGHVKWVWEQGRGVYSIGGELLALEGFITLVADDGAHAQAVLEDFHDLIMNPP